MKLIGGLLLPSEGDIFVNGLSTLRHNTAARRTVGLVMNEERSFFWRLTGLQNLRFFGALDNLAGRLLEMRIEELIDRNPILVTALNPLIGYEMSAKIAKKAYAEGRKVKEVAAEMTKLSDEELEKLLDPEDLTEGGIQK